MHYYQFNIKDYRKDTAHLLPIEHYIYRQLIDWYYLDEREIPKETQSVMRRLGLVSENKPDLLNVLNDFFFETETGWKHKRIEEEIANYHARVQANRDNGKKGGRPKKQQVTKNRKPKKTQSVNFANPAKSEKNPNQEPITNNQEDKEKTKGKKKSPSPEDVGVATWMWEHIDILAPGQKKPNFEIWADDIRKLRQIDGRSLDDIKAVFQWAHNDDFWRTNIRSPAKLRDRFDDLNAKRLNTRKRKDNGKSEGSLAEKNYEDGARLGVLAGYVQR